MNTKPKQPSFKNMKKIVLFTIMCTIFCAVLPNMANMAKAQSEQQSVSAIAKARADSLKKEANALAQAAFDEQNQRTNRMFRIIGFFGIIGVMVYLYMNHKPLILSIFRSFSGKYRIKGNVKTLESKKILIGAIYAEQQGACLNTLKADIDNTKLMTVLGDWWGIEDRYSAIDTLNYLKDKAFSYYFPTVYKAFEAGSETARKDIILSAMTTKEDEEKAFDQTRNLLESKDKLKELNLIKKTDEIEKYGVAGWDAGRLSFIARLCCDAQYISEDEAWEYIDSAYNTAHRHFQSWDDFAKSYVIGRFIWRGSSADDGLASIAENLVNKPDSLWNQAGW